MLLNFGFGEDSWESPGLQGDPTSPSWRKSVLGVHWKDWCWKWNSNILATWCEELTHLKRLWYWEGLGAGGEGDDRGWDGWMASPTQWTWVWVDSGRWWWTGKPGVVQFMGSQSVGHNWATELGWTELTATHVWKIPFLDSHPASSLGKKCPFDKEKGKPVVILICISFYNLLWVFMFGASSTLCICVIFSPHSILECVSFNLWNYMKNINIIYYTLVNVFPGFSCFLWCMTQSGIARLNLHTPSHTPSANETFWHIVHKTLYHSILSFWKYILLFTLNTKNYSRQSFPVWPLLD